MAKKPTVRITVSARIRKSLADKFKKYALEDRRTVNALLEIIIEEWIAKREAV